MSAPSKNLMNRRTFLGATAAGTAAAIASPAIVTACKSGSRRVLGQGDYEFEFIHDWAKLPEQYSWQTTHNVAVDKAGQVYVIHEGREDLPDHPSIFVFDEQGEFVRAFGNQFQGGGHGIEVREEDGEEFLYVCAYQQVKSFAKMSLTGETVWQKYAPMESGKYAEGEADRPAKVWGRDRFMPTNFAFLDNGDFFLADGYGSWFIHRYDKEGNWKSCFGGPGKGEGTFNLPHGIWIDERDGKDPELVVCDRAHHTVQRLTLEGDHLETLTGFGLPANIDTFKDLMVVPELQARVSILDSDNQVVVQLGDDRDRILAEGGNQIRAKEDQWQDGHFVHPHDACFDHQGNLIVAEWVATGRVSMLKRL